MTVNQDTGINISNDALQFAGFQSPIDDLQDRAQLVAGKECIQILNAIHSIDGHPVTLADSESIIEEVGKLVDSLIPFQVSYGLIVVDGIDQGNLVG